MRLPALVSIALAACSASSGNGGPADAGDAPSGPTCEAGLLVLDGSSTQVPHGSYAMTSVVLTGADFSATLPAGGSIVLSWSGDATAGPVTVTGKMYVPSSNEGTPAPWCIYAPSTLQVSGKIGTLDVSMLPATNDVCSGSQGPAENGTACFDLPQ